MDRTQLKDEIIFKLTGGIVKCELDDKALDMLINSAMRELQRYYDVTTLITIPFQHCIDLSKYQINSISRVRRSIGYNSVATESSGSEYTITSSTDPMYAQYWQMLGGISNLSSFSDGISNIISFNTSQQIRNTLSTDLMWHYDSIAKKLYVNLSSGASSDITIEYVPRLQNVEEISSDFWIDIMSRLCVALGKVALGRIRSKFKQTNALWEMDGETMLSEGNEELTNLREQLSANTQLVYGLD